MRAVRSAAPSRALWNSPANLASVAEDMTFLRILLTVCMAPLFGGSLLGGLLGLVGLELKKKWPPTRLSASASKRYRALLWMYNSMLLAL